MARAAALVLVGVILGAAGATGWFLTHRPASWQEQAARDRAESFACALRVGLQIACGPIAFLHREDGETWIVGYGTITNPHCYLIRLWEPTVKHPCV